MVKKDEKLDGMISETEGVTNTSSRSRVKAALEASRSAKTTGTGVKETKEIKEEKVMEEQAKKLTISDEIMESLEELENGDTEVDGESMFNKIMNNGEDGEEAADGIDLAPKDESDKIEEASSYSETDINKGKESLVERMSSRRAAAKNKMAKLARAVYSVDFATIVKSIENKIGMDVGIELNTRTPLEILDVGMDRTKYSQLQIDDLKSQIDVDGIFKYAIYAEVPVAAYAKVNVGSRLALSGMGSKPQMILDTKKLERDLGEYLPALEIGGKRSTVRVYQQSDVLDIIPTYLNLRDIIFDIVEELGDYNIVDDDSTDVNGYKLDVVHIPNDRDPGKSEIQIILTLNNYEE